MDAFDSDVVIAAAQTGHPHRDRLRALLLRPSVPAGSDGIGSVLLLPEVLSRPSRLDATAELRHLTDLLSRLRLLPTDLATAQLAASLGAAYRLQAAGAVHLATAVNAGADRFITNNRKDFPPSIAEIDIVYPDQLPAP